MRKIKTTRFGEIEEDEGKIIRRRNVRKYKI